MFYNYKKDFKNLKTFEDWLQWKKDDKKGDIRFLYAFFAFLLIVAALIVGFLAGADTYSYKEYRVACGVAGMDFVGQYGSYADEKFCIDSEGEFHKVIISENKAFIDNYIPSVP